MEKIVLKRLRPFLDPLLSPKQSGFRKHDSTSFQLLRLVQEWSDSLDASHLVGVIFFDFKKAFDRVCLPGLILKLKSAGLQGKALDWCKSFLLGRCQRVCVGSQVSSIEPLLAGVLQGAILSRCSSASILAMLLGALTLTSTYLLMTRPCMSATNWLLPFKSGCKLCWMSSPPGFARGLLPLTTRSRL